MLLELFKDERDKTHDRKEHLFANVNADEYSEITDEQGKEKVIFGIFGNSDDRNSSSSNEDAWNFMIL